MKLHGSKDGIKIMILGIILVLLSYVINDIVKLF